MRILKTTSAIFVVGMIASNAAAAQVNYATQGFFSGPGASQLGCTTAAALTAMCSGGGFTLAFTGTSGVDLANGTITSLGTFNLTGAGTATVPSGSLFFTLLVNQSTPTAGQGTFLGEITGSVSTANGTNFSSLIWTPSQFIAVGTTQYELIYDNVGPAANAGLGAPINNTRGISALVEITTTPEPGTVALLATGFAMFIPVAVRRRKTHSSA